MEENTEKDALQESEVKETNVRDNEQNVFLTQSNQTLDDQFREAFDADRKEKQARNITFSSISKA